MGQSVGWHLSLNIMSTVRQTWLSLSLLAAVFSPPVRGEPVYGDICKFGILSNGHRIHLECWKSVDFCTRNIDVGSIRKSEHPPIFNDFIFFEYLQEIKYCIPSNHVNRECAPRDSQLCFSVSSQQGKPLKSVPAFFPHELQTLTHPDFANLTFPMKIKVEPILIREEFQQVPKICDFVECEQNNFRLTTTTTRLHHQNHQQQQLQLPQQQQSLQLQ